ncbi:MAG: hypothetical protein LUG50_09435 [Planctomycetaceae bacterium]|nr:hypothetical protein [Planctomycetaceae bacterium]
MAVSREKGCSLSRRRDGAPGIYNNFAVAAAGSGKCEFVRVRHNRTVPHGRGYFHKFLGKINNFLKKMADFRTESSLTAASRRDPETIYSFETYVDTETKRSAESLFSKKLFSSLNFI